MNFSSIYDSTNNYSYLMGNTDNDLLSNDTRHIVRNIDNKIKENQSNQIKNLTHDLELIKSDLLKFMNNEDINIEEVEEDIKIIESKQSSDNENNDENNDENNNENNDENNENNDQGNETPTESEKKNENNITELLDSYNLFLSNYSKIQEDYFKAEKELKKDIDKTKLDIKMLNSSIEYTKNITKDYLKENDDSLLIENLKSLSSIIKNNTSTYEKKKNYIKIRNKLEKYIDVIRKMNLNISTTCSICMTNNVDRFFNPCGHTYCQKCVNRALEYDNKLV